MQDFATTLVIMLKFLAFNVSFFGRGDLLWLYDLIPHTFPNLYHCFLFSFLFF